MSNPQSPNLPKKTNGILTTPSESIVIVPRTYTEDEQAKIVALREYANTLRLPEDDPYYPWESKFLADPGCAERYMRAAKFKLDDAKKRIVGTLAWRREYKPELIPPEEVRIESETGKIILNGFDCNGRPIITMHPGRENTKPSERQLRHLVYVLERAIDLMPPGQDSLVIIVDYRSATLRTNPSISVASKVLTILQHHYVERLGRAIVVNLPFILSFFYKGIAPFLDPVTRDKMRFNPDLKELVPDDHLDAELGGSYHYEFEPKTYWDSLISACHIAEDGTRTTAKGPELAIYSDPIGSEGKTAVKSNQKGDDNGNTDNGNDRVVKRTSNSQSSTTTTSDDGDLEPRTPAAGVTVNDDTQKALSSSEKFRDATHENDREAKISDPETEATTVLVEPVNF